MTLQATINSGTLQYSGLSDPETWTLTEDDRRWLATALFRIKMARMEANALALIDAMVGLAKMRIALGNALYRPLLKPEHTGVVNHSVDIA